MAHRALRRNATHLLGWLQQPQRARRRPPEIALHAAILLGYRRGRDRAIGTAMERPPECFRVSTSPRRTTVENSSPSPARASAALAPRAVQRATISRASCFKSDKQIEISRENRITVQVASGHLRPQNRRASQ